MNPSSRNSKPGRLAFAWKPPLVPTPGGKRVQARPSSRPADPDPASPGKALGKAKVLSAAQVQTSKASDAGRGKRKRETGDEKSVASPTPAPQETAGGKRAKAEKAEKKTSKHEPEVDGDRFRKAGLPGMRELTMDEYMDDYPSPSLDGPELEHICYGDEAGGGHMHGYGTPGKTTFPSSWDEHLIAQACMTVAKYPEFVQRDDGSDTVLCIGEFGDQVIRVFRQKAADYKITAAYPVRKPVK